MNNAREYRDQTFGSTIQSILLIALGSSLVALLITGLITSLFMKLLLVKDKRRSPLKALGFTNQRINHQYLSRSLTVLLIGLVTGTLFS